MIIGNKITSNQGAGRPKGELLRIIMVTPAYHPVKGGTETVVRNLTRTLNAHGVHTDVMTFNMERKWNPKWHGKTEEIDGATVFRIPGLNLFPASHSDRITLGINLIPARFIDVLRCYDVIHFHELDFSFPLFALAVGKPKIIHIHGINVDFFRRYHLSRALLKHLANLYVSISKQMTGELLTLDIPRNRIAYLPNGVDTDFFIPRGQKEDNLILFVGRVAFNKGLHILLKSLRRLRRSVRLAIIGPPGWDLDYYRNILNLVQKENREGKHEIKYYGPMEQTNLVKLYQKASMLVLPSYREGLPVTVLESLACETPVVATAVGGIPEIVKENENGILVRLDDVHLSDAIEYLLDNREIRTDFGRAGRFRVVRDYSLESETARLIRIYEQLVK